MSNSVRHCAVVHVMRFVFLKMCRRLLKIL